MVYKLLRPTRRFPLSPEHDRDPSEGLLYPGPCCTIIGGIIKVENVKRETVHLAVFTIDDGRHAKYYVITVCDNGIEGLVFNDLESF